MFTLAILFNGTLSPLSPSFLPFTISFSKTLSQFMNVLSENSEFIQARKDLALAMIEQITKLRSQAVEHRPFGWDDMSAGSTHQLSVAASRQAFKQVALTAVGESRIKA